MHCIYSRIEKRFLIDINMTKLIFFQSFPVVIKITTDGRLTFRTLITFSGTNIYQDSHENTEYNRICSRHLDSMARGIIIKMLLMASAYWCSVVGPIYVFFANGTKTTTIDARVPGFEPGSNGEFMCNLLLMACFAMHGGLGYIEMEIFMAMFANVITLTPDLVRCELNEIARKWKTNTMSKLELILSVNNVVKQSLDVDK